MTSSRVPSGPAMRWQRLGLVWAPQNHGLAWGSGALQPTPLLLDGKRIRVWCGMRDEDGQSRIGWVDVAADDPTRVLGQCIRPALDIGEGGCFDECGAVPCAILPVSGRLRLYYAGYSRPHHARFTVFSGVAESDDEGQNFRRLKRVPALERSDVEPLFRVIHSIVPLDDGYRAWYGAGDHFASGQQKTLPVYDIRTLESADGLRFPDFGSTVIRTDGSEHRVGRPWVMRWPSGGWRMFYGYGSEEHPYCLGMAVSRNGIEWRRCDDQLGMPLSASGWDSQMMAYPAVVKTRTGCWLFYNGNNYGAQGFGVARLLDETDVPLDPWLDTDDASRQGV